MTLATVESDARHVPQAPPVVALHDVVFGYGARSSAPVVQSFSGQLAPGRFCVLLGPNAAGKSTLLKLMLGHLAPWSGRCELAGHDVAAMSAAQRAAKLSYVPQHGRSAFAFTVRDVVAMGRFALPVDAQAIARSLELCDLAGLENRVFSELSAGQQQRVLLARAVAQTSGGGEVMLLDEPVSSMDLRHVESTMRLLLTLARRGMAVLAVLHDLNLAARWADELWVMHRGRLAAAGSVQEVMRPAILEPVYDVKLRDVAGPDEPRPMLIVDSPRDLG